MVERKHTRRQEELVRRQIKRRIWIVALLLLASILLGTFGYYYLYEGKASLVTCAYMTIITLSTVGYGEVIPITGDPPLEVFTSVLILLGMGIAVYFTSALTAFIVGGEILFLLRTRRMQQKVSKLNNHCIIAGIGQVGVHVIQEMVQSRRRIVIIDRSIERIEDLQSSFDMEVPFVLGDATEDDILLSAGIAQASAIIFALGNDHENLFATITARTLNSEIRIITRGQDPRSNQKFHRAGADKVIYANVIGAMRMASESIRPSVVNFLDLMLKDQESPRRIEEIEIPNGCFAVGKSLRELDIRSHSDALIVAVERPSKEVKGSRSKRVNRDSHESFSLENNPQFDFNPGPNYVVKAGSKLVMIALTEDLPLIQNILDGRSQRSGESHAVGFEKRPTS